MHLIRLSLAIASLLASLTAWQARENVVELLEQPIRILRMVNTGDRR